MFGFCGNIGGMGWIGLILNLTILVIVIVGLTSLISWSVRHNSKESSDRGDTSKTIESAREIAQVRYARGEIDREQYQMMLKDLE
jgi:putative membrane protein